MDAINKILFLFCAILIVLAALSCVRIAKIFHILAKPKLDRNYMLAAITLIIIYTSMVINNPWS